MDDLLEIDVKALQALKGLEFATRRLVTGSMAGSWQSSFKGSGLNFDQVRPYAYGDDSRRMDWNVTARLNSPHIKSFTEERELPVWLLVDVSASMHFANKKRAASQLAALLAFSALKAQDRVGLVLFSDHIEAILPCQKGRRQVMKILSQLTSHKAKSQKTDISTCLRKFCQICNKRGLAFLISDFQAPIDAAAFGLAARKQEFTSCLIQEPKELAIPNVGIVTLQDPETGLLRLIDTACLSSELTAKNLQQQTELSDLHRRFKASLIPLSTEDTVPQLANSLALQFSKPRTF